MLTGPPVQVSTSDSDDGGDEAGVDDGGAARAGRAARAGTKVGRLIRLLRMVRILKLFLAKKRKDELEEVEEYSPSELGEALKKSPGLLECPNATGLRQLSGSHELDDSLVAMAATNGPVRHKWRRAASPAIGALPQYACLASFAAQETHFAKDDSLRHHFDARLNRA